MNAFHIFVLEEFAFYYEKVVFAQFADTHRFNEPLYGM